MRNFKKVIYILTALIIIYYIYAISVMLLKVGFKSASRDFFFFTLSIYLLIPLIKNIKYKRDISEELILTYKINKSINKIKDNNITKLQGVTIKNNNGEASFPCIITTNNGIFNIVFCKYKGSIIVREDNNWFEKYKKDMLIKVISPINAIRKNRHILKENFNEDEIIDLIVMTNNYVDINEEEISSVPIVKIKDLGSYIENYESEEEYKEEDIYNKLYPAIYKEKNIDTEINIYNKYLDNMWQYRSRFALICFSTMFYIFRVIGIYS